MIVCSGVSKQGPRVERYRRSVALEAALLELMRCYDRLGAAAPEGAGQLAASIARCLGARAAGRERVQAHVQVLLRARDLHHFIAAPAELVPLKLRLCEHLLHIEAPRSAGRPCASCCWANWTGSARRHCPAWPPIWSCTSGT